MQSTEIYAFVGWVGSFVAYGLFLVWSFLPESTLHQLGIYYYPDKSWALAIPSVLCMTIVFAMLLYQGLNMARTVPSNQFSTMQDQYSRYNYKNMEINEGLPEINDIPIPVVNNILYYQQSIADQYSQPQNKEVFEKNSPRQHRKQTVIKN